MGDVNGKPMYVPDGYKFQATLSGTAAQLLGQDAGQATFIFATGYSLAELSKPLTASVAAGHHPLQGTETRAGTPVATPDGRQAVYHDGVHGAQDGQLYWVRSMHSVTASDSGRSYAVRGPSELPLSELLRVLDSQIA